MERRSFYYLYANLNSLAELALLQMVEKALAETGEAGPEETLTQEEIEARVMAGFENVDLSALDGLNLSASPDEPENADAFLVEPPAAFPVDQSASGHDAEMDLESYLARAYSYEEPLRERVDEHYRRADLSAIDLALEQLPSRLPSLAGPLCAADMSEWLALYEQGHEVLTHLTVQVRRLDMS